MKKFNIKNDNRVIMKKLKFVFKVLCLLLIAGNIKIVFSQPSDLLIIASAGGEEPSSTIRTINISSNGEGSYGSSIPLQFTQPPLEEINFTLTQSQLQQIWQVIQNNDFFNLSGEYSNPEIYSRTFVRLGIRANGQTHEVITKNIAVEQFDNIILTINDATPGDADLAYDISPAINIEAEDPCEGLLGFAKFSNEPSFMNKRTKNQSKVNKNTVSYSNLNQFGGAHGGTTIAYRMSLEEAIDFGVAQLKTKGRNTIYGDEVEITVDNTGHIRNNRLTLTFYMAFHGDAANESILSIINNNIFNAFSGFTTDLGEPLYVETRTSLTPDFHSILPDYHTIGLIQAKPYELQPPGHINYGTTRGAWGVYEFFPFAHYAGHLIGWEDYYEKYFKYDNKWKRDSDDAQVTNLDLAQLLSSSYPDVSIEDIISSLENPYVYDVRVPYPGYEGHVMGMPLEPGKPSQEDINNITSNVGILVEVRPGTIVVNEDNESQNLIITHNLDLYVAPGEIRVLEGIYGACVDADKFLPEKGNTLHVAPPLDTWANVDAAPILLKLAEYLDKNNLYCDYNFLAQSAIWRLTDNQFLDDPDINNLFQEAGIEINKNQVFDFPRLSTDGVNGNSTTSFVPKELFVSKVNPFFIVISPGESLSLTEKFGAPSGINGFTANTGWSLQKPMESNSQLSNINDSTVSLTTDVRGVYRVVYNVDISDFSGDPDPFSARTYGGYIIATDVPTETFESGKLLANHFNWQTSEENPWYVTTESANSGNYSATTGYLSTGDVAELEIDADVTEAGKLSFASFLNAAFSDSLIFYIDGIAVNSWHGEVDWTQTEYSLTTGHHSLKWKFSRRNIFGNGHNAAFLDDVFFPENSLVTSVEANTERIPTGYQLFQNYPNPFNPTTNFEFQIADFGFVNLKIYDVLGREVVTLINEERAPGIYSVSFNASSLSSGVYFYKIETGHFVSTKKMILMK